MRRLCCWLGEKCFLTRVESHGHLEDFSEFLAELRNIFQSFQALWTPRIGAEMGIEHGVASIPMVGSLEPHFSVFQSGILDLPPDASETDFPGPKSQEAEHQPSVLIVETIFAPS